MVDLRSVARNDVDGPIHRDEFDGYIRRHEADENAHAAERHRQNNEWTARFMGQDVAIDALEKRMNAHDILHATARGEFNGVMTTVRIGLAAIGVLVTAFGGAILWKLTT